MDDLMIMAWSCHTIMVTTGHPAVINVKKAPNFMIPSITQNLINPGPHLLFHRRAEGFRTCATSPRAQALGPEVGTRVTRCTSQQGDLFRKWRKMEFGRIWMWKLARVRYQILWSHRKNSSDKLHMSSDSVTEPFGFMYPNIRCAPHPWVYHPVF